MTLEEKVAILSDPLKGAQVVASMEAEFNAEYAQWKKTFDLLESERLSKWGAYHNALSRMPHGTKTC